MTDLETKIGRAADRLMSAPEDLMDLLAPKLTAMKLERQRVLDNIKTAESAAQPIDVESETKAVVARLRTLADELDKSDPARVRELPLMPLVELQKCNSVHHSSSRGFRVLRSSIK